MLDILHFGRFQGSNPAWYSQLTGHLTEVQGKALTEVITLANQRVAAKESKQIEQQGGAYKCFEVEVRICPIFQVISSLKLLFPELLTLAHRQPLHSENSFMPTNFHYVQCLRTV